MPCFLNIVDLCVMMLRLFREGVDVLIRKFLQKKAGWGVLALAASLNFAVSEAAPTGAQPSNRPATQMAVPVVVDTYGLVKPRRTWQYTVNAGKHRLNAWQLGQTLGAMAKNKRGGATLPVAVLLDPMLTLYEMSALARLVQHSGMQYVRYFVYQANRSMLAELQFNSVRMFPENAFPRSRLEAEMMAAPK